MYCCISCAGTGRSCGEDEVTRINCAGRPSQQYYDTEQNGNNLVSYFEYPYAKAILGVRVKLTMTMAQTQMLDRLRI